jgi:hypothetical protein
MPRIRCRYLDCVFLDDGYCTSEMVEIDPDEGCMTYTLVDEGAVDEEWEDDEMDDLWDVDDDDLLGDDEEDDDLWLDEEL